MKIFITDNKKIIKKIKKLIQFFAYLINFKTNYFNNLLSKIAFENNISFGMQLKNYQYFFNENNQTKNLFKAFINHKTKDIHHYSWINLQRKCCL